MEETHDEDLCKRQQTNDDDMFIPLSLFNCKKRRIITKSSGFLFLRCFDDGSPPLLSHPANTNCPLTPRSICLRSDRLYTIGRSNRYCDIVFQDPRVSKRHCQILFDGFHRKILISDGFILSSSCNSYSDLDENDDDKDSSSSSRGRRRRKQCFRSHHQGSFRASTNGVFINGSRLRGGAVSELSTGDQVSLVCGNDLDPSFGIRIGFFVEKFVTAEEELLLPDLGFNGIIESQSTAVPGPSDDDDAEGPNNVGKRRKILFASKENMMIINRAVFLLNQCRMTLQSGDPISYIRECINLNTPKEGTTWNVNMCLCCSFNRRVNDLRRVANTPSSNKKLLLLLIRKDEECCDQQLHIAIAAANDPHQNNVCVKEAVVKCTLNTSQNVYQVSSGLGSSKHASSPLPSSSGNKFYLNRLEFMEDNSFDQYSSVSLPELLYPVESLSRVFIATFTSDVSWFLSHCEVPNHLPVTIACHNTDRCWSSDPDKRTSTPYSEFPNLVLVYPSFPDVIAFGKDRKKQGVACHHPKLLVLQREDSIRVVVSSANLVSKQWNDVTNTVWWQDFPRRSMPNYSSLFTYHADAEAFDGVGSDFAAQLAGFVASLVAHVPTQAQWIIELTKYDFGGATGHLVASVPGMHTPIIPYPLEPMYFLSANHHSSRSIGMKFLGSVEASVVGLRHRFHTAADSNGAQLKTLAAFIGKCRENAFGMSEVVLKRNTNIPADTNAVSVLICHLDEFFEGDYIQLGFLPRNIANWVAPLCDAGLFRFSACIYPKEVLAAALGGSNSKVQLILYVAQGPNFSEISSLMQTEHVAAIGSLIASVRRCSGLWRLKEVLCQYNWPELLETDFSYGSSSIGTSVDPKFLAAFSAATGKRSLQFPDSQESDPQWGIWNATEELRNPSMRILFPTIERVKAAPCGIGPSRRLLCFSERTWQRLRTIDVLHDAIPHPSCRVGYPMHVKVARRRFQSKTDTSSSFGWVYSGSHNFSPAAWGRPMSAPGAKTDGFEGTTTSSSMGPTTRLHICNYELGIIFVVPPTPPPLPPPLKGCGARSLNLDDIILPFVLPAPKYQSRDRPATAQAMKEALRELAMKEALTELVMKEEMMMGEEMAEEEEEEEATKEYVVAEEEKEEEKAYAETLWSQVDSSDTC